MVEKAYDGTFETNKDTFRAKRDFAYNLMKLYSQFLSDRYPNLSNATDNIFKLTAFLLDDLEKKADVLDDGIFQLADDKFKNDQNAEPLFDTAREIDPEKILLKMKLAEAEKELEDLRKESDDVYKFLINSPKKEVIEYAKKINRNTYANPAESKKINDTGRTLGALNLKGYTVRQMNDFVYGIMESKKAYDEKCLKARASPEILESYLFTYFKQKYGLKDLIMVEASTLVEKVKDFASKSIELETFKRILKNEVDEKFYWMLQSLKADFKAKLQQYFIEKIKPAAPLSEAIAFAVERIAGHLSKEEANFLLSVSYGNSEFKSIDPNFRVFFGENEVPIGNKNLLPYQQFLEFVFSHELEKHCEFLKYISDFFKAADDDHNGVINKKQFLNFLEVIAVRKAQVNIDELIAQADPHAFNRITFSKMIEVFSCNFADREKKLNLIQFVNKI